jgi:NAD(P)H-hydrate epimerase
MPQRVLNREQVRRVDRLAIERYGMTGLVLMENAGRGAAELIAGLGLGGGDPRRPIVIGCGTGNNGGDGFVIARHLDNCGLSVRLLLFGDPQKLTPDATANYEIARLAGLPIEAFTHPVDAAMLAESLKGAAGLVDALLGTGSHGEPKPPLDRAIEAFNAQGVPIVAIDVPSGLDCDTGAAASRTIRAAHTITFVAAKPGFFVPEAAPYVGRLHVVDIGVPRALLAEISAG